MLHVEASINDIQDIINHFTMCIIMKLKWLRLTKIASQWQC